MTAIVVSISLIHDQGLFKYTYYAGKHQCLRTYILDWVTNAANALKGSRVFLKLFVMKTELNGNLLWSAHSYFKPLYSVITEWPNLHIWKLSPPLKTIM